MPKIESKDLFRIAYLLCEGATLNEARLEEQRVTFVIEGRGLLEADSRYRTGQALINPLQLRESLNLLRDIIRRTQNPKMEESYYGKEKYRGNKGESRFSGNSSQIWSDSEAARQRPPGSVPVSC